MNRPAKFATGIVAILFLAWGVGLKLMVDHGFSAKDEPSGLEKVVARRLRYLSVPSAQGRARNPVLLTPEVLAEARAHFADHCALCHGNDGKGQTAIGQNLYPKAPDMQQPGTQSMPDGHLFFIIKNGVRLTGMPGWGRDTPEDDRETWALIHFIRHLPVITQQEVIQMEDLNPKTHGELKQEAEEARFLAGADTPVATRSPKRPKP